MIPQSRDDVLDTVVAKLQSFNKDGIEIGPGTDIVQDLSIDSLAVMDFVMELEEAFDISIPLNRVAEIRTVGDMVTAIEQATGARDRGSLGQGDRGQVDRSRDDQRQGKGT